MNKFRASGFTLIELLFVVAILATLTAVVLPKFDSVQSKVNHGVGAASADDTGRMIATYKVTKNKYPDGWDSLLDSTGTAMWTAADPTKAGIHTQLANAPISSTSGAKLALTTLNANEAASLARMGITKMLNLDSASTNIPGSRFTQPVKIADTVTVCTLNAATTSGKKMIDSIYPINLIPSTTDFPNTRTSGSLPPNKKLVVFGFGPKNDLIGTSMLETPSYPNVDLTLVYNRNLVAFEVDSLGGRADFKAVFGTDGDLKTDMAIDMFK